MTSRGDCPARVRSSHFAERFRSNAKLFFEFIAVAHVVLHLQLSRFRNRVRRDNLQLAALQTADGKAAVRARDLSCTHRERLIAHGFLHPVLKGWFIPSRPDDATGESTAWYASYWQFCTVHLRERFGTQWSLFPEQSLSLHAGRWTVPRQLMVRAPKTRNAVTKLPHGTYLLDLRSADALPVVRPMVWPTTKAIASASVSRLLCFQGAPFCLVQHLVSDFVN
jgi:hypothetical protein